MNRRFRMPRGSDGTPLSLLGAIAIAAILATLVFLAIFAIPYLPARAPQAATADGTKTSAQPTPEKPGFSEQIRHYTAAVQGRSLFFIPPPRPDAKAGPAPSNYAGPALVAMINDTAWFADGDRVSLAKPEGKAVRLVSLNPPWGARVEWEGGEYDVELFKRIALPSLRDTLGKPAPPSTAPAPAAAAPKPGAPPEPNHAAADDSAADENAGSDEEGEAQSDQPLPKPTAPAPEPRPGPGSTPPASPTPRPGTPPATPPAPKPNAARPFPTPPLRHSVTPSLRPPLEQA